MERLLDMLALIFAPLAAAWDQEFGGRTRTPASTPLPAPPVAPVVPTGEDAKQVVPAADVPTAPPAEAPAPVPSLGVPASVETAADLPPLFVRKGDGRGARYLPAEPADPGTRYRRLVVGGRKKYEPVK